jgi:Transposase DDE domain group 1
MIWLPSRDQLTATEFAPAMEEDTGILPGLPAVAGKPVHVGFDGGRLTSDGGILLLAAVEQRLKISERLAACIEDPRDPDRVVHQSAEMIRYRALLIAAGYPDGNDCDALKSVPAFKMAVGRLPESGSDLCSQPTISRLENLPGATTLKRMMAAMVDLFCDSFKEVPARKRRSIQMRSSRHDVGTTIRRRRHSSMTSSAKWKRRSFSIACG